MFKRRGFTLIELLVVIAIIGLLVAILLPTLERAKQLSRKTVCLAHLKAVGLCALLYAENNNDCMPISRGTYVQGAKSPTTGDATYHWYNLMSEYAGQKTEHTYTTPTPGNYTYYAYHQVFKGCPNWDAELNPAWNPGYGMVWMMHGLPGTVLAEERSDYQNYFYHPGGKDPKKRFWKRNELDATSNRGWIGDSNGWHIGGGPGTEHDPETRKWPTWAVQKLPDLLGEGILGSDPERHVDASNIWFIDGHARDYRYNIGGNAFYDFMKIPT